MRNVNDVSMIRLDVLLGKIYITNYDRKNSDIVLVTFFCEFYKLLFLYVI